MTRIEGLKSAADTAKHIITLATSVIALTVTFQEKFGTRQDDVLIVPGSLGVAWVFLGMAIILALWTLGSIAGSLHYIDMRDNGVQLTEDQLKVANAMSDSYNIRVPAILMGFLFVVGMGFTIYSGMQISV